MNQELSTSFLENLHLDALTLLEQTNEIIDKADRIYVFHSDSDRNDKKERIKTAYNSVENLELRMTFVAPTNAGKSTIINAAIGQEALPSRSTAMTTLPTEVYLNSNLPEPILEIDEETITFFQNTIKALEETICNIDNQRDKNLVEYPEMEYLVQKIQNQELIITPQVSGHQEIQNQLRILNDVIRICEILKFSSNPLCEIQSYPRIRTTFWNERQNLKDETEAIQDSVQPPGQLIIIDSPGPNEALGDVKEYSEDRISLWSVVKEQLQKSTIVVLVIDYTQLRLPEDSKIIAEIQEIQRIRGKNDLYILVNKIDQQQDGDIELDQLPSIVARKLKMEVATVKDRIFPISAKSASIATNVLVDVANYSDEDNVSDKNSVKKFAKAFQPYTESEQFLAGKTKKDLLPGIQQMLDSSRFTKFIENVLKIMLTEAAPRSIADALNTSKYILREISDQVRMQKRFIDEERSKITEQIDLLISDKCQLNTIKKSEDLDNEIKKIQEEVKKEIETLVNESFQIQVLIKLKHYFNNPSSNIDDTDVKFYLSTIAEHKNNSGLVNIKKLFLEKEYVPQSINLLVDLVLEKEASVPNFETIEFHNKAAAEKFISQVVEELDNVMSTTFFTKESYRDKINEKINNVRIELNKALFKNTNEILKDVCQRFQELGVELFSFNIDNFLTIKDDTLDILKPVTVKKKGGLFLSIWEFLNSLIGRSINSEEIKFSIKSSDIYVPIREIRECCTNIKDKAIQYNEIKINEQKDKFYKSVDSVLDQYTNDLQQASQNHENKELRKQQLDDLCLEIDALLNKVEKRYTFCKIK